MAPDVIVIGAGWGGLSAAAVLAHNGAEVLVLESTGHVGGRSSCDLKDGFTVDYGIHILSYSQQGAAASVFRELDRKLELLHYPRPRLYLEPEDEGGRGEFINMPTGVGSFLGTDYISLSDKMIIGHGVRRLIGARYSRIADVSLLDFIPGRDRDTVRKFFSLVATMGLVCPFLEVASAGDFSWFLRRAMSSREKISYPRGGTKQVNDGLVEVIGGSGEIRLNSRVKSMEVRGGRVASVFSRDEPLEAPAVIFAAPVQGLPGLVDSGLPDEYRKRCASLAPTCGISMDLCLDRVVSDLDSCFVTTPPIMMGQFTSNIDASTAPKGKQLATFFYPLKSSVMSDRASLEAEQKNMTLRLERMFPGLTEAVEWERVLRLKMVDGFEPRVGQTRKDRPGTRVPGVENLFLAGDCVGVKGKGGDVAFTSGIEAARAVLEYLG